MSLINVSNLTFSYDGSSENVFENTSFQIDTDWRLGFVGRNGRGKTTFLRLLMGQYPYSGTISASVTFEYFPYSVDKMKNVMDIFNEICPGCEAWEFMRELSLLDVSEDVLYRPFGEMSGGEQTKILLAMLFLVSNSFLLIDEPTNHLDDKAREVIGRYLCRKSGFILVSHDRSLLDRCTDHTLSINKANIEIQRGNFSSWLANKELQDTFEINENIKLKKEIAKLSGAAKRTSQWSSAAEKGKHRSAPGEKLDRGFVGHKAAKVMKRSKAIETRRERAVDEKAELLKNIEEYQPLAISPMPYHKARLVSADDLCLFYGSKKVCENISFEIISGDRIAVSGNNGCGKSSLLKLICGENIGFTGSLSVGAGLKISYVPQSADGLNGLLSEYAKAWEIDESLFKTILRKLGFQREQFSKNMADFSEGQKKKVLLAKSLCEKAHLYVWDEPLNFIDIFSRIQIENLLLEYSPTIIFVEHDKAFRQKIALKTIELGHFKNA